MRHAGLAARLVLLAGLMVLALAADLVGLALLLAAVEGLLLAAGLMRRQRVVALAAAGAAPFALVAALLIGPTPLAAVGPLALHREGLALGLLLAGRIVVAVAGAQWVLGTARHREALRLLAPWPRVALAAAGTLRFAPLVAHDWRRIAEAQATRGHRVGRGWRGGAGMAPLLVPLFVGTVRRGRLLQEAVEASAFGSGPRTRHPRAPATLHGAATALLGLALLGLAAMRLVGGAP